MKIITCPKCNKKASYNEKYDAEFCRPCDLWISPKCTANGPKECWFDCANRPDKPSQIRKKTRLRRLVDETIIEMKDTGIL